MLSEYSSEQEAPAPNAPPERPVNKQVNVIIKGKAPPASPSTASTVSANPLAAAALQPRSLRGPAARTPWPLPRLSTLGEPRRTGTGCDFVTAPSPVGPGLVYSGHSMNVQLSRTVDQNSGVF